MAAALPTPAPCLSPPAPPDLNKACGNAMDAHEAAQMHQNFSQQLLQDHIEACSLPEHNLITVRGLDGWGDGDQYHSRRAGQRPGVTSPALQDSLPFPCSGRTARPPCSSRPRTGPTPAWPVCSEAPARPASSAASRASGHGTLPCRAAGGLATEVLQSLHPAGTLWKALRPPAAGGRGVGPQEPSVRPPLGAVFLSRSPGPSATRPPIY